MSIEARAQKALRMLVDVKPGEIRALFGSFAYFFFLLASYYVLRPLRDEMAIAGGVDRLPWLFTATLGVMLLAVPAWSWLVARLPIGRLIPIVYRFFLAQLIVFFIVFHAPGAHPVAARVFFVWTSVFNLFVVSIFWGFMADRFHEEQGKRLFGFISAGGSAGAILGPALTSVAVTRVGPVNLILIAAFLLEAAAQLASQVASWRWRPVGQRATDAKADATANTEVESAPAPAMAERRKRLREASTPAALLESTGIGGGTWSAILLLLRSPYLLAIAGYVLFLTSTGTLGYMLQSRMIAAAAMTPTTRTALFARIDFWVNIGAAITQSLIAGRFLLRFGVGPALALPPVLTIVSALALGASPTLAILFVGQAIRRVVEYALGRPAREVLYTVVTREEKYKPKTFIDTVVYRGGDAASGWAFAALAGQGASLPLLAMAVIPLALVWMGLSVWLARRHEQRLRA